MSTTLRLLTFGLLTTLAHAHEPAPADVSSALAKLQSGNRRFVANSVSSSKPTAARRKALAQSQHPFAIVIGCADSRTAPEIVFDQTLGDLFVIRTAGNLVDDYALGSIEYAVEHLGCRLIVVMGHERCGAVKAAVGGGKAPGHIHSLVSAITPAVKASKAQPGDPLANAVNENSRLVAEKIVHKGKFGAHASEVKVVSAYCDLDTGKVSIR